MMSLHDTTVAMKIASVTSVTAAILNLRKCKLTNIKISYYLFLLQRRV